MAKGTKICKICGKEYPYCQTFRDDNIFRWQDVACCQEHGDEYFARVLAARSSKNIQPVENADEQDKAKQEALDIPEEWYEEDDSIFADDDENDEDEFDDYWYEEEFEK